MNFEFSDEQTMLREQARGFLSEHCTRTRVRETFEGRTAYDIELWQKIVELGWTAAVIPEKLGGLGLGYLELCVIAEELGRSLAPIPFSSSVYLATEALLLAGSEEQKQAYLPGLADGSEIGCLAVAEAGGHTTALSLETRFHDGKLQGKKLPVADGGIASFAIVFAGAQKGDGATAYLVDLKNVRREALDSLDPARSQSSLTFDGATADQLGKEGEGWHLLQRVYDRAAVLFAWEQIGGASAALDMARDFSLERFAFGRAIGSFQAIKHKLAQGYVKNALARSNCYYGAWALSTNALELPIAAATSRVSAIQAYHYMAKENIQTHGGMGFTWESDCHFFYRRSKLLATIIGSEMLWREKLIKAIEADRAA